MGAPPPRFWRCREGNFGSPRGVLGGAEPRHPREDGGERCSERGPNYGPGVNWGGSGGAAAPFWGHQAERGPPKNTNPRRSRRRAAEFPFLQSPEKADFWGFGGHKGQIKGCAPTPEFRHPLVVPRGPQRDLGFSERGFGGSWAAPEGEFWGLFPFRAVPALRASFPRSPPNSPGCHLTPLALIALIGS